MNRWQAAWQTFKSWGGGAPKTSAELLAILNGQKAVDGENEAFEDFGRVSTLTRAYWRIASDLASAPLLIERKTGKGKWEALDEDDKSFGNVAGVFKKANRYEGRTALWMRFYLAALLRGESFLLTDYENEGARVAAPGGLTTPRSLRVLRADAVSREFRSDQFDPWRYRYCPPGQDGKALAEYFEPNWILDHRRPHPREDWRGLSPARASQVYTKIEDELSKHWRNFLLQGARGSVLLSFEDTIVTPEQIDQVRQTWDARYSGSDNAGAVWVIGKGGKAQELQGRKDADWAELFRMTKEQGGMVAGVPPAFLGDYSTAALANIKEQTPLYVEGTLHPEGTLAEENLTEIVLPRFDAGGSLRARIDWDKVPMVQRMNADKAKSYFDLAGGKALYTREEARVALGMNAEPELGDFDPDPLPMDPNKVPGEPPQNTPPRPPARSLDRLFSRKWIDDPIRHDKRARHAQSVDRLEAGLARELRRYFREAQGRILARLPENERKDFAGDLYESSEEIAEVVGLLVRHYTRVYGSRAPEALREIGVDPATFQITDPRVQAFIERHAYENGTRIVGTAADKLRVLLAERAASGETLQSLADDITDLFGEMRRSHALTIARTETIRSYNAASVDAWAESGVVRRIAWLTAKDDAVRESHAAIDGEEIELGGIFSNGCQFPGDPAGAAEETINCRCTVEPIEDTEPQRGFVVRDSVIRSLLTTPEDWKHPAPSLNGGTR